MFPFKQTFQTKNITKINGKPVTIKPMFIIVHSTGTGEGTLKGNLNVLLGNTTRQVSAHALIDTNGDAYKLSDPTFITWHAGESKWKDLTDLNKYSIGIEVIGIDKFTDLARHTTKDLILHLMKVYNISKDNVLTHAQIAPGRKTDINKNFWEPEFKTWEDWKNKKLI